MIPNDIVLDIPLYLHLHRLAVDELAAGHNRVEDDGRLLAAIQNDVVAFTLNMGELMIWIRIHCDYQKLDLGLVFLEAGYFFFLVPRQDSDLVKKTASD